MAESPSPKKKKTQHRRIQNVLERAEEVDFSTAKDLLEGGSDVNSSNERGETLLHWAAANGRLRLVKYLLLKGAELEARCHYGNTALSQAAKSGTAECINVLLRSGARINVVNVEGKSPMHLAASKGNVSTIGKLIEEGANIHIRDHNGQTALYSAVCYDSLPIVKLLLDAGADIDATSNHGNTPLHIAAQCHRIDIVKFLLEKGAEVNIKNMEGYTPLTATALLGDLKIVKVLIQAGADINSRDRNGRNTLHAVIALPIYMHMDVVVCKELIYAGSDILSPENSHPSEPLAPLGGLPVYFETEACGRTPLQSSVTPAWQRRMCVPKVLIRKILLHNPRASIPSTVVDDPALFRCWETSKAVVLKIDAVKLAKTSIKLRHFLLENDVNKLAGFLSPEVQEQLTKCAHDFRTYGEMIRYQLSKGKRRIQLTNAVNIVFNHSEAKDLPNEIRSKIYLYLSNTQMRNIVKSVKLDS